ncbi:MAG TPA: signal peptidase I [Actinomycetes bacterium]|jgi:signal peptidase I|nr:signal peptidase I [Actinomycetes bacterium]
MRALPRGLAVGGLALLAGGGLVIAARRARLEPLLVQGDSMRPTLPPGQRIAVGPRRGTLRRGEVVLLRRAGREMVKRVVGLPGEHVLLAGGRLEVNGRQVAEPWTDGRAPALPGAVELDVHLDDDELVVLGDSRRQSTDSRSFGPVRLDDVIGVVRFAYWPPRRVAGTGRAPEGPRVRGRSG